MGYFLSQDEWVIRKDVSMLADAGVDVMIMDVTNAVRYWDEWDVIFRTMQRMKAEGNKVPKFCFWAFNGPVITVVQDLYDRVCGARSLLRPVVRVGRQAAAALQQPSGDRCRGEKHFEYQSALRSGRGDESCQSAFRRSGLYGEGIQRLHVRGEGLFHAAHDVVGLLWVGGERSSARRTTGASAITWPIRR